MSTEQPNTPQDAAPDVPRYVDQAEIDAALKAATERTLGAAALPLSSASLLASASDAAAQAFREAQDLGLLTQAELDEAIRAAQEISPRPATSTRPADPEIDRLLAEADAEPTNFAAAEAALRKIDQAETDALTTGGAAGAPKGGPPQPDSLPETAGMVSQDELDTLLGSPEDARLDGGDLDAVINPAEAPQAPELEEAIRVDAAPVTLGQAELDTLLSAHPLVREEPVPTLPLARAPSPEDPVERAARENAASDVGRENLAAAVPDPTAAEQPLGKDLIDSLVAQAAQAATASAPRDKMPDATSDADGVDVKPRDDMAVELSDDDFAEMGISVPPAPAPSETETEQETRETEHTVEDASPVVQRRLRGRSRSLKLLASAAAFAIVGAGSFAYLWLRGPKPAAPDEHATSTPSPHGAEHAVSLEQAIAAARDQMALGDYVSAMKGLGKAIRTAEPGPLLNDARFMHVEAGYRSLPPQPKDVDIETVLKNIEDVIAMQPEYARNAEALMWKADLYRRTGAPTLARDTYERILTNYPDAPNTDRLLLEKARISYELKSFGNAITDLERLLAEHPDSSERRAAQLMLAQAYENSGRIADAESMYQTILAECVDSRYGADAALALARLATAAGDRQRAIGYLETRLQTATTVDGNDGVYVELVKSYRAAGKPVEAARIAREFLSFFPESSRVPEAVIELTQALEASGEREQAAKLAQQAAERFDKDPLVARNRAVMLSRTGNARAAAEALLKADALGANDPALVLEAAEKFLQVAETEKAEEQLRRLIETYPTSSEAVDAGVEVARIEYARGEYAGAIDRLTALETAARTNEQRISVHAALGDIYSDLGLTRRATISYEKVAALTTDSELLAKTATRLLENGATGSALPVIRKVDVSRLSSKTGFHFLMAQGRALLPLDPEQALGKMQQAFDQYPVERTPDDFEFLVRACLETGRTAHARALVRDFDLYVQTHPEERPRLQRTAAMWGDALFRAGDYRGALDAYEIAAMPAPNPAPPTPDAETETEDNGDVIEATEPPTPDMVWATYQRANALLKLDDFTNSVPIFEKLAATNSPYAEDARLKAEYAKMEQRMRAPQTGFAGGDG